MSRKSTRHGPYPSRRERRAPMARQVDQERHCLALGLASDTRGADRALRYRGREGQEAARLAPKIRRESANLGTGETCDDYFGRLATAREAEGIVSVRKDKYDWGKWIAPRIGKLPIAVVTRDPRSRTSATSSTTRSRSGFRTGSKPA